MSLKFTFDLPTSLWREPAERFVALAPHYEAAGFLRFGVADWRFYPDLFVEMTACLLATQRLELESLVTDPFVRHPSLTALAMATCATARNTLRNPSSESELTRSLYRLR